MEYGDNYDNFKNAIKKAKTTCKKSGYSVDNNFSVMSRKSLGRPAEDYILSRYACLLIAQNADSNKQPEKLE